MFKSKKILFLFFIFIVLFTIKSFAFTNSEILNMTDSQLISNGISINEIKTAYNYDNILVYEHNENNHISYWCYLFNGTIEYDSSNSVFIINPTGSFPFSARFNNENNSVENCSFYADNSPIRFTLGQNDTLTFSTISIPISNSDEIFFQQRSGEYYSSSGSENNEPNNDTERTGFFSSVGNWFSSVISGLTQGFTNVIQNITSILDYLNPFSENFFGYKLVDLIRTILTTIFVPDRDTILTLVNNTKNKFSFIDDIKSQITTFKSFLNNINSNQTYSFTMNNKYFSGTVYIIDLSWFASLKPWTDAIITGFVYLKFLWSLFIKAPGIIAGQPMNYDFEGMRDDISVGGRLKSSSRRT